MARSRNIKPAFFQNENLVELRYEVRLLFIGLWTLCDREGRMEDRPKRVKIALFPCDDLDIDAALCELVANGFVRRYEVDNIKIIQVVNFLKHQRPHHQEVPSWLPEEQYCSNIEQLEPRCEDVANLSRTNRSDSLNLIPDTFNTDSLNPSKTSAATKNITNKEKLSTGGKFAMYTDWKPEDEILADFAHRAGLHVTLINQDIVDRFFDIWASNPLTMTEEEWIRTFVVHSQEALRDE